MKARSRATDPATSHLASDKANRTGKAQKDREAVLSAVKQHPEITSAELADVMGWDRHRPARRLPELREAGLIVNGEKRRCRVTGNFSITWEAVSKHSGELFGDPKRLRRPDDDPFFN